MLGLLLTKLIPADCLRSSRLALAIIAFQVWALFIWVYRARNLGRKF